MYKGKNKLFHCYLVIRQLNSREKALFRHQESFGNDNSQHIGIFEKLNTLASVKEENLTPKELEARIFESLPLNTSQIRRSAAHLFKRILRILKNNVKDKSNQLGAYLSEIESLRARGLIEPAIPLCDMGLELAIQGEEFEKAVLFLNHKIEFLRTIAMGEEWPEITNLIQQRINLQKSLIEVAEEEQKYFKIKQLIRKWQKSGYSSSRDFKSFDYQDLEEPLTLRGQIFRLMGSQNIAYTQGQVNKALNLTSKIIDVLNRNTLIKEFKIQELLNQYQLAILFSGVLRDGQAVNHWVKELKQQKPIHEYHILLKQFYLTLTPLPFYMDQGNEVKAQRLYEEFQEIKPKLNSLPEKNSIRLYYRAILHLNYSSQKEQALRLSYELRNLVTHKFSSDFRFGVDLQHLCLLVDNREREEVVREVELIGKRLNRNEENSPYSKTVLSLFRNISKSRDSLTASFWKEWDKTFSENHQEYSSEASIYVLSLWVRSKFEGKSVYSLIQRSQ